VIKAAGHELVAFGPDATTCPDLCRVRDLYAGEESPRCTIINVGGGGFRWEMAQLDRIGPARGKFDCANGMDGMDGMVRAGRRLCTLQPVAAIQPN
jgi:hypothetical protein